MCSRIGCLFDYIVRFAVEGRGTLYPVDPTKKLLVTGLYKFPPNPMYIGVGLVLIGEAAFSNWTGYGLTRKKRNYTDEKEF